MNVAVRWLGIVLVVVIVAVIGVVVALLLSRKKSTDAVETKDGSYFDGGTLAYIGYNFLVIFVTSITFGIAFPWMCCLMQRWKAQHTVICGKRQVFDGTGVQLIGKFLLWGFLSLITFGIYGFWMALAIKKWIAKHTHFVGEEDNNSYFDGGILGFIGTNILAAIVTAVPFVGFAWSNIIKLRWERKHTVVDSRRLVFEGTVGNFFLKYLLWGILTVITFGIYALFVPVRVMRLETEYTIDHEHTNKALMAQSEYRNTVQNTVSSYKNSNTEFEMEGLKAGINDTTDESALRTLADNGLRCAQYLYATRYADGEYATEPYAAMLKASAQSGYAPAMCLYALTNEMEETEKNDLLCKAADLGQLPAVRSCISYYGNAGLAASKGQEAKDLMEKAVFYADVLEAAGEELTEQEQQIKKQCVMKLRKMESDKSVSSKWGAGVIAIIIVGVILVLTLLIGVFAMLFRATPSPAPVMNHGAMEDIPYVEDAGVIAY